MDKINKPSGKKSKITALSLTGLLIRCAFTAVTNGYAQGFLQGKIYRGKLKLICMPGLNCYSCPGALGSCPIGSLQAVLDSGKFRFSCYVLGFLVLFGAVLGRFVCGWLCPFGLVQDLLHKIPLFQKKKNLPCLKSAPEISLKRYFRWSTISREALQPFRRRIRALRLQKEWKKYINSL